MTNLRAVTFRIFVQSQALYGPITQWGRSKGFPTYLDDWDDEQVAEGRVQIQWYIANREYLLAVSSSQL